MKKEVSNLKKENCRYYSEKDIEPALNYEALANLFRVSKKSAYHIVGNKNFKTMYLFGRVYYHAEDIIKLINDKTEIGL